MKTKSCNHLTVTARPTADAKAFNDNSVARMGIAHNIGKKVYYLDAVMYAHKGTKLERTLPLEKFTKGNLLKLDGYLQPKTAQDGKLNPNEIEFVITKVSDPEVIQDSEPENEEESEGETE